MASLVYSVGLFLLFQQAQASTRPLTHQVNYYKLTDSNFRSSRDKKVREVLFSIFDITMKKFCTDNDLECVITFWPVASTEPFLEKTVIYFYLSSDVSVSYAKVYTPKGKVVHPLPGTEEFTSFKEVEDDFEAIGEVFSSIIEVYRTNQVFDLQYHLKQSINIQDFEYRYSTFCTFHHIKCRRADTIPPEDDHDQYYVIFVETRNSKVVSAQVRFPLSIPSQLLTKK